MNHRARKPQRKTGEEVRCQVPSAANGGDAVTIVMTRYDDFLDGTYAVVHALAGPDVLDLADRLLLALRESQNEVGLYSPVRDEPYFPVVKDPPFGPVDRSVDILIRVVGRKPWVDLELLLANAGGTPVGE
jgi:hypothetical protein